MLSDLVSQIDPQLGEMISVIRSLVEIESPSEDKTAVDRLGKVVAQRFAAIGGKPRVHRVVSRGDHLQIDFTGGQGKPILLLGHLDTVYPFGTLARMPFRQHKHRLYGPGVLD